ncbi:MAG: leucyl aminopeptidase [Saprospiraceae bacterium]|nr:leucyl aminopeptidase [Saprospiraceae bacterium]
MKRVYLSEHNADRACQATAILALPSATESLSGLLTDPEMQFLTSALARQVRQFFFPRPDQTLFVRILEQGTDEADTLEITRRAGAAFLADMRTNQLSEVVIRTTHPEVPVLAFAEGLALGSYSFKKYRTKCEKESPELDYIGIDVPGVAPEAIRELDSLIEAVFITRDLVNEPHMHFNAIALADAAREVAGNYGLNIEVLGKEEIEALGMGGLLAVNRASSVPPFFCILEWKPETAVNPKPMVLVGKGVVYDTGGLSLKTAEGMETMKCDMAGAGAVLGAMAAAARNRLPVHVIGLIPATDNMIGEKALAPGDIIQMYSGDTVEVVNTDAEGRIILADALHYAKRYDPELVLDVATLTGAAVRALGNQAICYMGNASRHIKSMLEDSGWNTYERCVELPLWKEYGEELKSSMADLKNVGNGPAGMITAGKFLEYFANFPWLHLDIAGPAYLRSANAYRPKDGTGVGVRLLYNFLKQRAKD